MPINTPPISKVVTSDTFTQFANKTNELIAIVNGLPSTTTGFISRTGGVIDGGLGPSGGTSLVTGDVGSLYLINSGKLGIGDFLGSGEPIAVVDDIRISRIASDVSIRALGINSTIASQSIQVTGSVGQARFELVTEDTSDSSKVSKWIIGMNTGSNKLKFYFNKDGGAGDTSGLDAARATITGSGKVGLGLESPSATLHLAQRVGEEFGGRAFLGSGGLLILGSTSIGDTWAAIPGANMVLSHRDIQSRLNGTASPLNIQPLGGSLTIGELLGALTTAFYYDSSVDRFGIHMGTQSDGTITDTPVTDLDVRGTFQATNDIFGGNTVYIGSSVGGEFFPKGPLTPDARLQIMGPDLVSVSGSSANLYQAGTNSHHRDFLVHKIVREGPRATDSTGWYGSRHKLGRQVDNTWMGYIEFGDPSDSPAGVTGNAISFGQGNDTDLMTITTKGIGIGTNVPLAPLHIESSADLVGLGHSNHGILMVGTSAQHLEFDGNEIQERSGAAVARADRLYIQPLGGDLSLIRDDATTGSFMYVGNEFPETGAGPAHNIAIFRNDNDRVGIRQNNPSTALDVNGTIRANGSMVVTSTGATQLAVHGATGFSSKLVLYNGQATPPNNWAISMTPPPAATNQLQIHAGGTQWMHIKAAAGEVRIFSTEDAGDSNATSGALQVMGGASIKEKLFVGGTGSFSGLLNAVGGIQVAQPATRLIVSGGARTLLNHGGSSTGNVSIGASDQTYYRPSKLSVNGAISMSEQSSSQADSVTHSGYGQVWVKNDAPTNLMFTNDAGTDHVISAYPPGHFQGAHIDWVHPNEVPGYSVGPFYHSWIANQCRYVTCGPFTARDQDNLHNIESSSTTIPVLCRFGGTGSTFELAGPGAFAGTRAVSTWFRFFAIKNTVSGDVAYGFDDHDQPAAAQLLAAAVLLGDASWTSYIQLGWVKSNAEATTGSTIPDGRHIHMMDHNINDPDNFYYRLTGLASDGNATGTSSITSGPVGLYRATYSTTPQYMQSGAPPNSVARLNCFSSEVTGSGSSATTFIVSAYSVGEWRQGQSSYESGVPLNGIGPHQNGGATWHFHRDNIGALQDWEDRTTKVPVDGQGRYMIDFTRSNSSNSIDLDLTVSGHTYRRGAVFGGNANTALSAFA